MLPVRPTMSCASRLLQSESMNSRRNKCVCRADAAGVENDNWSMDTFNPDGAMILTLALSVLGVAPPDINGTATAYKRMKDINIGGNLERDVCLI